MTVYPRISKYEPGGLFGQKLYEQFTIAEQPKIRTLQFSRASKKILKNKRGLLGW
jgi:hypothetical protein